MNHRLQLVCRRKVAYFNILAAMKGYIESVGDGSMLFGLEIYRCDWCGGYHLGKHRAKRIGKSIGKLSERPVILKLIMRKAGGGHECT